MDFLIYYANVALYLAYFAAPVLILSLFAFVMEKRSKRVRKFSAILMLACMFFSITSYVAYVIIK